MTKWSRLCPLSKIRELKISPMGASPLAALPGNLPGAVHRYSKALESHYRFHQQFWQEYNLRFENEKTLYLSCNPMSEFGSEPDHVAIFCRKYMTKYRKDFANYHEETRRRAFLLLWEEVRFSLFQLSNFLGSLFSQSPHTSPALSSSPAVGPSFSRQS